MPSYKPARRRAPDTTDKGLRETDGDPENSTRKPRIQNPIYEKLDSDPD